MRGYPYRVVFALVDFNFTAELENNDSLAFQNLAANVLSSVLLAHENNPFFLSAIVNGFRSGSVIADVTIVFSSSSSTPLSELVNDANADNKIGNLTVVASSIRLFEETQVSSTSPPPTDNIPVQTVKDVKNIIIATLVILSVGFFVTLIVVALSIGYLCTNFVNAAVEVHEMPSTAFSDRLTTPTYRDREIMEEYY